MGVKSWRGRGLDGTEQASLMMETQAKIKGHTAKEKK